MTDSYLILVYLLGNNKKILIIRPIILIKYIIREVRKSDFRAINLLSRVLSKE